MAKGTLLGSPADKMEGREERSEVLGGAGGKKAEERWWMGGWEVWVVVQAGLSRVGGGGKRGMTEAGEVTLRMRIVPDIIGTAR